jgi:hypothetical protein
MLRNFTVLPNPSSVIAVTDNFSIHPDLCPASRDNSLLQHILGENFGMRSGMVPGRFFYFWE